MRIAFYAPMKPVDHPVPSGDRRIARLFVDTLTAAGHEVQVASRFRSLDITGDSGRQARIAHIGQRIAERLVRRYKTQPHTSIPQLWFTYHLYHKAPDWIGPRVCRLLDIPYVIAEASFSPSKADGPWCLGATQSACALSRANGVLSLNPRDIECLQPHLAKTARQLLIAPFLKPLPTVPAREDCRRQAVADYGLDSKAAWLICTAMMRTGDKLASYQILADTLPHLADLPWQLLVVGDGEESDRVRNLFSDIEPSRIRYAGRQSQESLSRLLAASDLFIWPAVNEAFGMAILEAQLSGLPVIAGYTDGVAAIVDHGVTGLLCPTGQAGSLANAARQLLTDGTARKRMGHHASEKALRIHSFSSATQRIKAFIAEVVGACH